MRATKNEITTYFKQNKIASFTDVFDTHRYSRSITIKETSIKEKRLNTIIKQPKKMTFAESVILSEYFRVDIMLFVRLIGEEMRKKTQFNNLKQEK